MNDFINEGIISDIYSSSVAFCCERLNNFLSSDTRFRDSCTYFTGLPRGKCLAFTESGGRSLAKFNVFQQHWNQGRNGILWELGLWSEIRVLLLLQESWVHKYQCGSRFITVVCHSLCIAWEFWVIPIVSPEQSRGAVSFVVQQYYHQPELYSAAWSTCSDACSWLCQRLFLPNDTECPRKKHFLVT